MPHTLLGVRKAVLPSRRIGCRREHDTNPDDGLEHAVHIRPLDTSP